MMNALALMGIICACSFFVVPARPWQAEAKLDRLQPRGAEGKGRNQPTSSVRQSLRPPTPTQTCVSPLQKYNLGVQQEKTRTYSRFQTSSRSTTLFQQAQSRRSPHPTVRRLTYQTPCRTRDRTKHGTRSTMRMTFRICARGRFSGLDDRREKASAVSYVLGRVVSAMSYRPKRPESLAEGAEGIAIVSTPRERHGPPLTFVASKRRAGGVEPQSRHTATEYSDPGSGRYGRMMRNSSARTLIVERT